MFQICPLLPASLAQKYIRIKRIKLNGGRAERDTRLQAGDVLQLYINDEFFDKPREDNAFLTVAAPKLNIVYEDDKAYFAGLVHDVCKEVPPDELRQQAIDSNLFMTKAELETKALWHAVAGAGFVRDKMNISDNDIINAVRFHTIARAGMSRLEEIVYIGDLISADRNYKDVKRLRKLAYQDIDKTMFEALVFAIESVLEKKGMIPDYTMNAYNQYVYINNKHN